MVRTTWASWSGAEASASKTAAAASMTAGSGLSPMRRWASLVEMWRAVPGCVRDHVEDGVAVNERRLVVVDEGAEDGLLEEIVPVGPVLEESGVEVEGPAGEAPGGFEDIVVDIGDGYAARTRRDLALLHDAHVVVGAEGVQLEEFASPVLVGTGVGRGVVVEVVEHGGVLRDLAQHGSEVAEGVAADDHPVPVRPDRRRPRIRAVDVEVVVPEVGQDLEELAFAPHRPQQRGALDFVVGLEPDTPRRVRLDVVLPELGQGLVEGGETGGRDPGVAFAVVDARWVELLIDPDLEPLGIVPGEAVEGCDIAGSGAETESIEGDDRCRRGRRQRLGR